jgi:hypothetical protein
MASAGMVGSELILSLYSENDTTLASATFLSSFFHRLREAFAVSFRAS